MNFMFNPKLLTLFFSFYISTGLQAAINLEVISTIELEGGFDDGAAEISAYDSLSERLYTINGSTSSIEIIDLGDPSSPVIIDSIDLSEFGDGFTSVDVSVDGVVAAALEADDPTDPGTIVFMDTDGTVLSNVNAGFLPDSIKFTPDGNTLVVANEGEPIFDDEDMFVADPEGSISIIDVSGGAAGVTQMDVSTADFTAFNGAVLDSSIRIIGPTEDVEPTVAQDLEPEFIVVSDDSSTAYVSVQENNALAVVDIATATVTDLLGLGFKDHSIPGRGLDASDEDGVINIATYPVMGMYQPDGIAFYSTDSGDFIVTANEGDSRGFEETSVADLTLDPDEFPNAADLQMPEVLGELEVTNATGSDDGGMTFQEIFAFGARSFSIWDADTGELVFDSGDDFEQLTALQLPDEFNSNNDENDSFDSRSNDKGPEPEGVVTGQIGNNVYAFIGLERIGGVMVYDVTDPVAPAFIQYINNRDFSFKGDLEADKTGAGDLGPEGLVFISADNSPTGIPYLVVSNEISGTVTVYSITQQDDNGTVDDDNGCSLAAAGTRLGALSFATIPLLITFMMSLRRYTRRVDLS